MSRWGWRDALGVGAPSAFVAVVAGTQSLDNGVSYDEAFSLYLTQGSWTDLWERVGDEHSMVLHDLALWLWLRPGGGIEAARVLSTVFAIATVALTYALARRLLGTGAATFASTLLVLNDLFLEWSGFARGYTLAMACVVLSMLALVHTLDQPHRGWAATHVVVGAVAVYAHPFALTVLLAQIVALTAVGRAPPFVAARRRALVATVLAMPLVAALSGEDDAKVSWIPGLGYDPVRGALGALTGRGGISAAVPYLLGAALVGVGLLRCLRGPSTSERRSATLLAAWVAVPIAFMLIVSVVRPLIVGRYLLVVVPGLVIAEVLGLRHLSRRLRLVGAGLLLLAALWGTALYLREGPGTPGGEVRPGQPIVSPQA